jgi:hypothetical protein
MGLWCRVAKNKVKDTSGANIEAWIVKERILHVLLVKLAVYLGAGSLYRVMRGK